MIEKQFWRDFHSAENLHIYEIKMSTHTDNIICGIPFNHDEKSLILYHLAEGGYLPDGFMIIRKKDVSAYCVFDSADCFMRRRQVKLGLSVPLDMFSDGYNYRDAIHKLSASQQLVEIHRYASDKLGGFLVGTINNFDKDNVLLETVDEYGQKDDILNINCF